MTWFRNLGIARKLAVAFTLTTAMTLALGAFALVRLAEAHAQLLAREITRWQRLVHDGAIMLD